jgi:hypothetical protein
MTSQSGDAMTETNPLYARPLSTSYQADLFSIKDDHPEPCAACGGLTTYEVMIATFTEETSDEDPLYPGRSAARAAAHGEQPVPQPQRQLRVPQSVADVLQLAYRDRLEQLYSERERYIARALGHTQLFPERVQPVPDDLEPELDPERVTHSIDEPYAVIRTYDDAVAFAEQQLALYGSVYVLAADPVPVDPAEDGE